jgi:hypothetical protein
MEEEVVETYPVELTCTTSGCFNAGVTIRMDVPVDCGGAVCGVCDNPIPIVVL